MFRHQMVTALFIDIAKLHQSTHTLHKISHTTNMIFQKWNINCCWPIDGKKLGKLTLCQYCGVLTVCTQYPVLIWHCIVLMDFGSDIYILDTIWNIFWTSWLLTINSVIFHSIYKLLNYGMKLKDYSFGHFHISVGMIYRF